MASKYICVVTLINSDTLEDATILMKKDTFQKSLLGQTAVAGQVFVDLNSLKTIFFVFHDLSVRIQGNFTLRCSLVDVMSWFDYKISIF